MATAAEQLVQVLALSVGIPGGLQKVPHSWVLLKMLIRKSMDDGGILLTGKDKMTQALRGG